jgi:hypothetical protein
MTGLDVNSTWQDEQGNRYQIIHIIHDDAGHVWVHYRRLERDNPHEYSCWQETFVERFREVD